MTTPTTEPALAPNGNKPATADRSARHPKAYVREAHPHEMPDVIACLTRAFASNPAMNWYGSVAKLVTDVDSDDAETKRTLRNLSYFQSATAQATAVSKGIITVVVVPAEGGEGQAATASAKGAAKGAAKSKGKTAASEGGKKEHVIATALWLPPGQTLEMGPVFLVRAGVHKLVMGWGITGLKRVIFEFGPAVEKTLEHAFKSRGLDRLDSWHLLELVTDPAHEGKGYASMLMEDGYKRTSPKPIHLEASGTHSRDIYLHWGFEIDEEHRYGIGDVDEDGCKAKGSAATGFPEWIMTKWHT